MGCRSGTCPRRLHTTQRTRPSRRRQTPACRIAGPWCRHATGTNQRRNKASGRGCALCRDAQGRRVTTTGGGRVRGDREPRNIKGRGACERVEAQRTEWEVGRRRRRRRRHTAKDGDGWGGEQERERLRSRAAFERCWRATPNAKAAGRGRLSACAACLPNRLRQHQQRGGNGKWQMVERGPGGRTRLPARPSHAPHVPWLSLIAARAMRSQYSPLLVCPPMPHVCVRRRLTAISSCSPRAAPCNR